MNEPTAPAETDHATWAAALLRRQAELLEQVGEAAARMALAIEASTPDTGPDKPTSIAFARVHRALRMGGLLQTRLVQEIARIDAGRGVDAARRLREADQAEAVARALADPDHDHKARVERIVERIARAECGDDEDRVDSLVAECGERLDDDDIYRDVASRSVKALVQQICKDLDLDERPFLHEAWATEEVSSPGDARPPPFTGEVAQRAGGGMPPLPWFEGTVGLTAPPDG